MKPMTSLFVASMLAVANVVSIAPAVAIVVVAPQVTGRVTAIPSSTVIVVDGHQYLVAANSPAFKTLQTVHVGDSVGLMLDGPAKSSASHVTSILVSPAQ